MILIILASAVVLSYVLGLSLWQEIVFIGFTIAVWLTGRREIIFWKKH
jgi:lysylphosphatidylglycerol synthetase-like protein (DUF2156 family)